MSGSRHFAQTARKIVYRTDRGVKGREEQWKARRLMQQQQQEQLQEEQDKQQEEQLRNLALNMGFQQGEDEDGLNDQESEDADKKSAVQEQIEMACACGERCSFSIALANLSRVLWMAYEEYELLHACYADLFADPRRCNSEARVNAYWRTFVLNAKPSEPHNHTERLWRQCQREREEHLAEKARLPVDPVAPLRRSLIASLLDPFGYVKCRCVHCAYLDAVMDYRVALFDLLTEYCSLFKDYARLVWSSSAKVNETDREVTLHATGVDRQMFKLTMNELYTAMSFDGETENVMKGLDLMHDLIYR